MDLWTGRAGLTTLHSMWRLQYYEFSPIKWECWILHSGGTNHLPKIIILIKQGPQKEGIGAELGKEKQRGRDLERVKEIGNSRQDADIEYPSPARDSRISQWRHMPGAVSVAVVNGMWSGMRLCAVERMLPKIKAYLCLQLCPFKLAHHCSARSLLCAIVSPLARCQTT